MLVYDTVNHILIDFYINLQDLQMTLQTPNFPLKANRKITLMVCSYGMSPILIYYFQHLIIMSYPYQYHPSPYYPRYYEPNISAALQSGLLRERLRQAEFEQSLLSSDLLRRSRMEAELAANEAIRRAEATARAEALIFTQQEEELRARREQQERAILKEEVWISEAHRSRREALLAASESKITRAKEQASQDEVLLSESRRIERELFTSRVEGGEERRRQVQEQVDRVLQEY